MVVPEDCLSCLGCSIGRPLLRRGSLLRHAKPVKERDDDTHQGSGQHDRVDMEAWERLGVVTGRNTTMERDEEGEGESLLG